MGAVSAFTQ
jgi:hypothetical protein